MRHTDNSNLLTVDRTELPQLDRASIQAPTVLVRGSILDVIGLESRRPDNQSWAGPRARFEGDTHEAIRLRALRSVIRHVENQPNLQPDGAPTDFDTTEVHSWLVRATQSISPSQLNTDHPPTRPTGTTPRSVLDYLSGLRDCSKDLQKRKDADSILEWQDPGEGERACV
jgi:hypothetical protein